MILPPTVYRILTWGQSPNKLVILGIQILLLANLIFILISQVKVTRGKAKPEAIANSVRNLIPVYLGWSVAVVAVFPVQFGFN